MFGVIRGQTTRAILVEVAKFDPVYAAKTYDTYQAFAAWPKDVSINAAGVKAVQGVLVEGDQMKAPVPDPAKTST